MEHYENVTLMKSGQFHCCWNHFCTAT